MTNNFDSNKDQSKHNQDFVIENGTLIEYIGENYDIVIPDYVTAIAEKAIKTICLSTFLSLTIPKRVTYIHPNFMEYKSGFKSIKVDKENKFYSDVGNCLIEKETKTLMVGTDNSIIPDDGSVMFITERAFANCKVRKVTIPNGVESIEDGTFLLCEDLEEIDLPEGIKTIKRMAFCGCNKLKKIILPQTVSNIEDEAFQGWGGNIVIQNNGKYYSKDKCLIDSTSKKLIACFGSIIPSDGSVELVGTSAFSWNRHLFDVVIPDGVTYVGDRAFSDCRKLKSIVFSDSVTKLEANVFWGCTNLEKVVLGENVSEIGTNCFDFAIYAGNKPIRKLKEVVFQNPKGWSIIYDYWDNESLPQEIPEETLSNPIAAAKFILKEVDNCNRRGMQGLKVRGAKFKRS